MTKDQKRKLQELSSLNRPLRRGIETILFNQLWEAMLKEKNSD